MPLHTRPISLLTADDRLEIFVRGERLAAYRHNDCGTPGFVALYASGERALTQPAPGGLGLWLMHGNVNGVGFGVEDGEEGKRGRGEEGTNHEPRAGRMGRSQAGKDTSHEPLSSSGRIVTDDLTVRRGTYSVGFRHTCGWIMPDGQRALTTVCTYRALPGPSEGAILDMEVRLQSPQDRPVTLGRADESLLCIRAASGLYSVEPFAMGAGQTRNSLGEYGAEQVHGRAARWCANVGVVDGETCGFAFLEHPHNPAFPSPWIARPDGVLSPSPFAWRSQTLAPGEELRLRYRLHTHLGYVNQGWADARLMDYAREVS